MTNLASVIAVNVTATNQTDTSAVPGLVYYYWVRAESAVAAGAWCGAASGYALLTANFADKKPWARRDTKKMDTLIGKQLPAPWGALLNQSWSLAIMDVSTRALASGPFELVTSNNKIWTLKNAQTPITYTAQYNKRKGTDKATLTYKFLGDMPNQPGIYLHLPATL